MNHKAHNTTNHGEKKGEMGKNEFMLLLKNQRRETLSVYHLLARER